MCAGCDNAVGTVLNTGGFVTPAVKFFVFSRANCETGNYTSTSRFMVKVKTSMVTGLLSGTPNTGWNSVLCHFIALCLTNSSSQNL